MIRNLHPADLALNRAEMDRREDAAVRELRNVISALYATAGVAYGLTVAANGADVTVSEGVAIVPAGGLLDLAVVRTPQTVDLPDVEGTYGIYLRHDALVRLEPTVVGGATVYRREASDAYAANGLPASEGVIVTPGLVYAASGSAVPNDWVLLAQATRSAGVVTVTDFDPTPASLRGAVEDTGSGGGLTIVTQGDLDAPLLSIITRALLTDGTRPMTGSLNLGGFGLNAVAALHGVTSGGVEAPVAANVTRLEGKTAAEIIAAAVAAGGGQPGGGGAVPTEYLYTVAHTQPLGSGTFLAPRNITARIPDGVIVAGKSYATLFAGEGTLLSRAGQNLTLQPQVRLGTIVVAAWQGGAGAVRAGRVVGVSGNGGAFYASTVVRTSPTEVKHILQKVVPGDAPTVTAFDNVTLAVEETTATPPPYDLTVGGGALVWGTRNTGISVAQSGDTSNPDVAAESDWVRGFLRREVTDSGMSFQRGTQSVNGSVLLIQSDTALPVLAVS